MPPFVRIAPNDTRLPSLALVGVGGRWWSLVVGARYNWALRLVARLLVNFPAPASLTYAWSLGSLLGLLMVLQVATGFMLVWYYVPATGLAFTSVDYIRREVGSGWLVRGYHLRGARAIFAVAYAHMLRGLWYRSFQLSSVWLSGRVLLVLLMAIAFMGYVLPWGSMSLWGATVITNLVSTVPVVGGRLVLWVWGGFSVSQATLSLLFALHFVLPLVLMAFVVVHLVNLHQRGSTSVHGLHGGALVVRFHPAYTAKDRLNVLAVVGLLAFVAYSPWALGDSDNWVAANPLVSPVHIKPEWYYLWAYALLRAVPNKLGGVVALVAGLVFVVLLASARGYAAIRYQRLHQLAVAAWLTVAVLLTWLGGAPVEYPLFEAAQVLLALYFGLLVLVWLLAW